jgi:putative acetyltransferase
MTIVTARTEVDYEAAIKLFKEYAQGLGIDLQFQNFDAELATLPIKYGPPTGELWLVKDNDLYVGCAAIYRMEEGICELKRMYLKSVYRGQQLGEQLLTIALHEARQMGYHTMRLDSLRRLVPAIGLYQKFGFEERSPYNYNPEADVVYFEKVL